MRDHETNDVEGTAQFERNRAGSPDNLPPRALQAVDEIVERIKKQPPPNENWCVGCSPDNCCGCPPEPCSGCRHGCDECMTPEDKAYERAQRSVEWEEMHGGGL